MVNQRLFRSASICGLIHLLAIIEYWNEPFILLVVYGVGVGTSVWNHSVTLEYAKWADRILMFIGALMDLFCILAYTKGLQQFTSLLMLGCAVSLYFLEKLRIRSVPQDFFHQSAHYLITISHLFLLHFLNESVQEIV